MKFYIVILFGILLQFLSLFLLQRFWFSPKTPDLIIILAVYLIAYEQNDYFALFACWFLGLLKDTISAELFGLHSMIFATIAFLLLRLKQTIHLNNVIVISSLVFFFTLQYYIIHSIIIFIVWDVDLSQISVASACYTAIFTPLFIPILDVFNEKKLEDF